MPVIDVQVHPFDRNHPGRPWASPSHGLTPRQARKWPPP